MSRKHSLAAIFAVGLALAMALAVFSPLTAASGDPAEEPDTDGRKPSEPRSFIITGISEESIDFRWQAPANPGHPSALGYVVKDTATDTAVCGSTDFTCSFENPVPGTEYRFALIAQNGTGSSPAKFVEGSYGSLPSKIRDLEAAATPTQLTLTWKAPNNVGAPALTTYVVFDADDNEFCRTADRTCSFTVEPNRAYVFTIVAKNAVGNGPGVELPYGTQRSLPSAPRNFEAAPTASGAELTWTAPEDTGSSDVVLYEVTDTANSQTVCTSPGFTCTASDLDPGKHYNFQIVARNNAGPGAAASTSATIGALPSRPLGVKAQPIDGGVILTWNPPADLGSPALYEYVVRNPSTDEVLCITKEFTCKVVGLVNGKNIGFNVVARNDIGDSLHTWVQTIPKKSDHVIVVRAKGEIAEETFSVSIGDTEIGRSGTTANYVDYTFDAPATVTGPVTVTFTNDLYNATTDRNLWLDWVKVNGTTYESEAPTTYSEGAWTSGFGCSPGFRANERITCGGTFTYAVLNADGAETAPGDPYLPEEPTAAEAPADHVVRVRAKGHVGGERFAVRIGTEMIGQVVVTNQWRTYRFKLDTLPSGKLVVGFMNDSDDGVHDFNLQVDWVKVDKQHHETEDARIYMAGPGPDAACQSGHKQSETLYCSGAFFYADL